MGIPDRTADLEDAATGDRLVAPFAELRRAEPGSVGAVEPPAA